MGLPLWIEPFLIKYLEPQAGQARSESSSHFLSDDFTDSRAILDNRIMNEESKNAKIAIIKNTNLMVIIGGSIKLANIVQDTAGARAQPHHYFHITTRPRRLRHDFGTTGQAIFESNRWSDRR